MKTNLLKFAFTMLLFGFLVYSCTNPKDNYVLSGAQKLIVVLTQDWDSTPARIYLLEKHNDNWKLTGKKYTGVIGKNGFGWGIGLHNGLNWEERFPNKQKKEGDKRSPAGLFTLSDVMGYGERLPFESIKKYVQIHGYMHAVDDTSSEFYNQIVDTNNFENGFLNSYNSYEDLAYMGNVYKWFVIIDHNSGCIRGAGSNIYFHIRNEDGTGTGGCTAVKEEDILEIINWIDNTTLLLQLPEKVYNVVKNDLGIPKIRD